MIVREANHPDLFDFAAPAERAGYRLHQLELLNWGTFDKKVWRLEASGDTSLLTGDIGSGKSTIVDALTTLLIAPQKVAYNKAAGAEARERSARSYFLGHYKAERSDTGTGAKPVSLRDAHSLSVLLAHFFNEGYQQHVTLAQVFWMKDQEGQPARLFVVADQPLSITEHFSGISDIPELRRRLKGLSKDVHDSYPPYMAAFRKRLGIVNDQALDLFHQTVSMKSVGNLTDFVRQHMLQPFPVDERIANLIAHVDDLTRAHEAVLKAKEQLRRLTPLIEDCDLYDSVTAKVAEERDCRDALKEWFATQRVELLSTALKDCVRELDTLTVDVTEAQEEKRRVNDQRDGLKQDIARNGGERMERLRTEIDNTSREKTAREQRASAYDRNAEEVGLPAASDAQVFAKNTHEATQRQDRVNEALVVLRKAHVDDSVRFRDLTVQHKSLSDEVESLRQRKSNIPADVLRLRTRLCESLGLNEEELPFAGELMRVHEEERPWEGAIERVLRGFGTSLLVPDEYYSPVAKWVDHTHLGTRLVYHRVKEDKQPRTPTSQPASLVRKLEFKHDSPLAGWIESEVTRQFNPVCCDTLDEFRREQSALTRNGQIKGGVRHIKDDRSRVDDRTRYVLGWSNSEKIAAVAQEMRRVERQAQTIGEKIAASEVEEQRLRKQLDALKAIAGFRAFEDIDWRQAVLDLKRLDEELRVLERTSDVLRELEKQLCGVETALEACEKRLNKAQSRLGGAEQRRTDLEKALARGKAVVEASSAEQRSRFGRLEELRIEFGRSPALTVDNGETVESDVRAWLQSRIDADELRLTRLGQKIVSTMQDYRNTYPVETREADASVDAAGEYRKMLVTLEDDDLPRFERRFKELLNENTIREVANFQSQLGRERHEISERIEVINKSLREIDFNPGRFIRLESANAIDVEVRDFQQDLKACTEGTLTGSGDDTYSEIKFVQVKKIIERFRGREGSTDIDQKWTRKVTDVRNWFTFSASERWAEDDREHEHYTDSGGKSGGQKEKLAYTVLAASLAYQFGLEWGDTKSRSFRFVVIDEAFGRGSDDSAAYGLELFQKLNLQLLVVTPLQKIHVIEPFVSNVAFVSNTDGESSKIRNLTIEEYREEKARRGA
jgi:uncharacterized protein YPO0396